jgi:hypothetical protein
MSWKYEIVKMNLFSSIGHDHILSILTILFFSIWILHKFKLSWKSIEIIFAFGFLHETLFSLFAVIDSALTFQEKLGFGFILLISPYLIYTQLLRGTLSRKRYLGVLTSFCVYLVIWVILGFHLTHDAFTGQSTVYLNDFSVNATEIGSWLYLAILFYVGIRK